MGKSDLLKDSMKTGLDGLLSPTGKTPQPQRPAAPVAEKEPACIAFSSSTGASIPA